MPLSFEESYRVESKFLVEEYMLLANILVAEFLYNEIKDKALLRAHPDVDSKKKEALFFFKIKYLKLNSSRGMLLLHKISWTKNKVIKGKVFLCTTFFLLVCNLIFKIVSELAIFCNRILQLIVQNE